jgi:hypothetical protein
MLLPFNNALIGGSLKLFDELGSLKLGSVNPLVDVGNEGDEGDEGNEELVFIGGNTWLMKSSDFKNSE